MCLICDHIGKNKLKASEAWKNLKEMYDSLGDEHAEEVLDKIWFLQYEEDEEIPWDEVFSFIIHKKAV